MPTEGVTVAIATRDRPGGLTACLAAILAGTASPAEILVVDQGDPRPTADVIAASGARVAVRHLPSDERGLSRSRNAAAAAAGGAVLAMTDDDCIPGPGWLAALAGRLDADPSVAGVTGPIRPGPVRGDRTMAVSSRLSDVPQVHADPRRPWLVGSGGNFAVRLDDLRRVGGFDTRLGAGSPGRAGEDLDVFARLLAAGLRIAYVPEAAIEHERAPAGRRWSTRWTYGFGAGAVAGIAARREPRRGGTVLGPWLAMRARRAAGGLRHADLRLAAEELVVVTGTAAGALYGVRARG